MLTMQAVLYAKDARHLATFYGQVLGLATVEEGAGFVLLACAGVELTVVQAPAALADALVIARPPVVRRETPVKLSFAVADIEALRPLIEQLGGGLRDAGDGWPWRGARHLDGWDPEGNVFQLRQREP